MTNEILQFIADLSGNSTLENAQELVTEWCNNTEIEFDDTTGIWIANPSRGHWLSVDDKAEFSDWLISKFGE